MQQAQKQSSLFSKNRFSLKSQSMANLQLTQIVSGKEFSNVLENVSYNIANSSLGVLVSLENIKNFSFSDKKLGIKRLLPDEDKFPSGVKYAKV